MFITGYCSIRNFSIGTGDGQLFSGDGQSLPEFTESALDHFSIAYPKFYKMDLMSRLGVLAAEILLKDKRLPERYDSTQVSLVLANASASLDTDKRYAETMKTIPSPALFVYTLPNIVSGEICIRHGIRGENAFFVLPEFDAGVIADYTDAVMATGKTLACISGWVEVMGKQHDVFLYLTEKLNTGRGIEHTASNLRTLYSDLWKN